MACFVSVRLVTLWRCRLSRGESIKPLSRSARCVFDGAERDVLRRAMLSLVLSVRVLFWRVKETTYTVGVAAASMLHGGMYQG